MKYRLTADMKEAAAALNLPLAARAMTLRQIYADAPGQGAVVWNIHRPGHIAFDVLPRRHHLFLCSAIHPIAPDLGVQMDVHLIGIEAQFVRRQFVQQATNLIQTLGFRGL